MSLQPILPHTHHFSNMLKLFSKNFRRFCSHLRWPTRYLSRRKVIIKRFGRSNPKAQNVAKTDFNNSGSAMVHPNNQLDNSKPKNSIRIATFNAAALFSMAPATPKDENFLSFGDENGDILNYKRYLEVNSRAKSVNDRPKSILKQSHLHSNSMNDTENLSKQQKFAKSKLRVSINLPDNEISLLRNQKSNFAKAEKEGSSNGTISKILRGKGPLKSSLSFSTSIGNRSSRTVVEILRELDAGILALQDVKAVEENGMKPLSDLASALGMDYVFAESWAPEYGNTVLSKWPIKRWKVQKIFDDTDFRNVLKATIDVPQAGEINLYCTHLDHLDDNWRMKQIDAIMRSNNEPHILAGVLNVLDETDYSGERWADIVKYYEEMGKPTPKVEVMRNLKSKQYTDAKDVAGECESVVMIAKGQSVQGTCKYGTRVDYILSSPNSPYKFVPGSYSVLSSKGTSDHHIVKVDITKVNISTAQENATTKRRQPKHKVVKITQSSLSRCIWKTDRRDR